MWCSEVVIEKADNGYPLAVNNNCSQLIVVRLEQNRTLEQSIK